MANFALDIWHATHDTHNSMAPPMQGLSRVDLNEQAYAALRQRLLTRELRPGQKLNVRSLAEELGVSRSPIQHAMTRLIAEGLVSSEARRGFYVKPLTACEVRDAHDFRMLLEVYAAERAVGRIGPPELKSLRGLVEAAAKLVREGEFTDRDAYILANQELHQYIVDLSGNPFASSSYRRLTVHTMMVRTVSEPARRRHATAGRSVAMHQEILEAYEAGDVERAKKALRTDIENGAAVAMQAIESEGGVL